MSAKVKILIKGFTNADSKSETGEERTQPTITLVKDGSLVMVVDPGILDDQQILIDALAEEGLTVKDVNMVFVTHSHLDHYRNVGMFAYAKTLDYYGIWSKNTIENWSENLTANIQVLHTPGHDYTGITLLVKTIDGVVAICGDVFWKENYPREPEDDAFASNPERLRESREMILKMADWIIPGHSGMYKNKKAEGEREEANKEDTFLKTPEPQIAVACKKCGMQMKQKDKCQCRPYLCYKCCECCLDCDLCNCSHRK